MPRMRNALAAISAVIILAAGLTGCVGNETPEEESFSYKVEVIGPSQLSINESSGKITKYLDSDGAVIFEEGASPQDTVIETFGYRDVKDSFFQTSETLTVGEVTVNATSTLHWTMGPSFNSIQYFNQYIASEDYDSVAYLSSSGVDAVDAVVTDHINARLEAAVADGTVPRAQYEVAGDSFVKSNSLIAQAYAEGKQPMDAWSEIYKRTFMPGEVDPNEFQYSFLCASLDASISYKAMEAAALTLFTGVDLTFSSTDTTTSVDGLTKQPCAITTPLHIAPPEDQATQPRTTTSDDSYYDPFSDR